MPQSVSGDRENFYRLKSLVSSDLTRMWSDVSDPYTPPEDRGYVAYRSDIGEWVAGHRDDVGVLTGGDRPDPVSDPAHPRRL
jgi:hypothetical protein